MSGQSREMLDANDPIVTPMMARTDAFLARAGLVPEKIVAPLGRTLQRAAVDPRSLVFGVRRRPRMEDQYHWILQLTKPLKLALYARTGDPEAVKEGIPKKGMIACYLRSYECEFMLGLGVPASQLMAVPQGAQGQIERLLLSGRVRYLAQSPGFAKTNLKRLGYGPEAFREIWLKDSSAIYLVADKTADKVMVDRLLAVSQEDLPLLACD
ncbi:hypothetical protein [Gimibacter soli]|uniref:Solute-binding protein family 3/N-terminal domain-containing protein n=1 Tax=Gimibacter soli TaxID=3024400 RepID=A0AAE9XPH7_9PROT|nr:hypothetical protein [Gimibacter soli]WCL53966.1 hypothetical protein PH603_15620 [Gimibacter soli]